VNYVPKIFFQIIKSRKSYTRFLKFILVISVFFAIVIITIFKIIELNNNPLSITRPYFYVEPQASFYRYLHNNEEKDWHNNTLIEYELNRKGPGEQGKPHFAKPEEEKLNKKLFNENGYYGLIRFVLLSIFSRSLFSLNISLSNKQLSI
jgi:hypothetical protein